MNNVEKGKELVQKYKFGDSISPIVNDRMYDAVLEMAYWKDQWFESLLTELMICAQQGYTQCASDEMVIKEMIKILKGNEL